MRQKHRILRNDRRTIKQTRRQTVTYHWSQKHIVYIRNCAENAYNIAEGAVRAGKTVDNVYAFAHELKTHPDKVFLATGATAAAAKMNIGDSNGMGLEWIFRGQCRWGKYKGTEALMIKGPDTGNRLKVVVFAGGGKADSYKSFRGFSIGMWIATEVNLHHDNTIKEAFNRTLASGRRKFFWDLNPDHPNAPIYKTYIDKYVEKAAAGEMEGGVNFEKFTIFDNINISEENRLQFISQYEKGTIWYNRDVLGQRSIAEGLIYPKLAGEFSLPRGETKPNAVTRDMAMRTQFMQIVIGVDFGGNGSGHAFVASGITPGYGELYALRSRRYVEGESDEDTGEKIKDIDPKELGRLFVAFVREILRIYGYVTAIYCDSAEQVLIRGLRNALAENSLGNIRVMDALKDIINDRIFTLSTMSAQNRFKYVESDTKSLQSAIGTAVWDPKKLTENVRLDDGTSDIDSMDAFEYSFEGEIDRFIKRKR